MDEHINNGNTTENTDKQPYNNYDYSDEEYERMRIEMEKRRAERRAREHRRVMKNRIIAIAILFGDNFCDSESLRWKVRQQACC